jgi:hypothetical protein
MTYPTDLDEFTNPSPSNNMNDPTVPHDRQHADINNAVEAIEGYLGDAANTDNGTITGSLANHKADKHHLRSTQGLPRRYVSAQHGVDGTDPLYSDVVGGFDHPHLTPILAYTALPTDGSGLGKTGVIEHLGDGAKTSPAETFLFTQPWVIAGNGLWIIAAGGQDKGGNDYGWQTTSPNPLTDNVALRKVSVLYTSDPANHALLNGAPLLEVQGEGVHFIGLGIANQVGSGMRWGHNRVPAQFVEVGYCIISRNAGYGIIVRGDTTDNGKVHDSYIGFCTLGGLFCGGEASTFVNRLTAEDNEFHWNGTWTLGSANGAHGENMWTVAGYNLEVQGGGGYAPWAHHYQRNKFFGPGIRFAGLHGSKFGPANYLELSNYGPDSDGAGGGHRVLNRPYILVDGNGAGIQNLSRSLKIRGNNFHQVMPAELCGWSPNVGQWIHAAGVMGLYIRENEGTFSGQDDGRTINGVVLGNFGGMDYPTPANPLIYLDNGAFHVVTEDFEVSNQNQTAFGLDSNLTLLDMIGPASNISPVNAGGNWGRLWDSVAGEDMKFGHLPRGEGYYLVTDGAPVDGMFDQVPGPGTFAFDETNNRWFVKGGDAVWRDVEVAA